MKFSVTFKKFIFFFLVACILWVNARTAFAIDTNSSDLKNKVNKYVKDEYPGSGFSTAKIVFSKETQSNKDCTVSMNPITLTKNEHSISSFCCSKSGDHISSNCYSGTYSMTKDLCHCNATSTQVCFIRSLGLENEKSIKNHIREEALGGEAGFTVTPKIKCDWCTGHRFTPQTGTYYTLSDSVKSFEQEVKGPKTLEVNSYDCAYISMETNDVSTHSQNEDSVHQTDVGIDITYKPYTFALKPIKCQYGPYACGAQIALSFSVELSTTLHYSCYIDYTAYTEILNVYLEGGNGTWVFNQNEQKKYSILKPVNGTKCPFCDPNGNATFEEWYRDGDATYMASGTHPSSSYNYCDDNINRHPVGNASVTYDRYIYRRPSINVTDMLVAHGNPQANSSTTFNCKGIPNSNFVGDLPITKYRYENGAIIPYETHETFNLPGTWNCNGVDYTLSAHGVLIGDNNETVLSMKLPSPFNFFEQIGYEIDDMYFYDSGGVMLLDEYPVEIKNTGGGRFGSIDNGITFIVQKDGAVFEGARDASYNKTKISLPNNQKHVYAHWLSDPSMLIGIFNSRVSNGSLLKGIDQSSTDSAMAAHDSSGENGMHALVGGYYVPNRYNPNGSPNWSYWNSFNNSSKRQFDANAYQINNPGVENITVNFVKNHSGNTYDFNSYTTDVSFKGWKEAKLGLYGYDNYYHATSAQEDGMFRNSGLANACDSSCDGHVHGKLLGSSFKFNHNYHNWNFSDQDHAEKSGNNRVSAIVATYNGSWDIVLPNAYRNGYIFTGWYADEKCKQDSYVGMAGDIIDLTKYVREYNTSEDGKCSKFTDVVPKEINGKKYLSQINLYPCFEPLKIKVLYDMNIPEDDDSSTAYGSVQSHTLISSPEMVNNVHSYMEGGTSSTTKGDYGSTYPGSTHYSYISSKIYEYNGSDWELEPLGITVNDYDFTGWKYADIIWGGYGSIGNSVRMGDVIGGTREDVYDINNIYSLKTLYMSKNPVFNYYNNAPDTTSDGGRYDDCFKVLDKNNKKPSNDDLRSAKKKNWINWLDYYGNGKYSDSQSDGGPTKGAGNKTTGRNDCKTKDQCVYIVLAAQWTDSTAKRNVEYNSNNERDQTKTHTNAFSKYTDYVPVRSIKDPFFSTLSSGDPVIAPFGGTVDKYRINSKDTVVGDTSDDGSYDKNATSDTFVVDKANSKYYNGTSNGRTGFFSFQGWSVWKYATWREAIDSNKKDTPDLAGTEPESWPEYNSELQPVGKDGYSMNTTYDANALTFRKYNDATRGKRAGDLYYRMASVLYNSFYGKAYPTYWNDTGNMLDFTEENKNVLNAKYSDHLIKIIWNDYTKRWRRGSAGTYQLPMNMVTKQNIKLYAIWDSYPTSKVINIYCDKDDIEKLTPSYLFSKVTVYDYEDFYYNKHHCIGSTSDGNVDWNTVCTASDNMNKNNASSCPAGDYTYTYKIKGDKAIMPGEFKATLIGYDYSHFENVRLIDDIGAVSMTFRFEDSAGNTTFKTAWIYITDNDDDNYDKKPTPSPDPDDPDNPGNNGGGGNKAEADNTRYSTTRFISEDNYNKAEFDDDGNYVYGSAKENDGALLLRSKWYMDDSYKAEIQEAFANLKTIGDSSLELDFSPIYESLASNSGTGPSLFDMEAPSLKAVWTGDYHPQLNEDGEWVYDWNKIAEKTVGVYRLGYDDIVSTKQLVRDQFNLSSDKFSRNTMGKFLTEFRKRAYKSLYGRPDPGSY